MGILDTIINTKQHDSMKGFKPADIVNDLLATLKERDRQILTQRYGLDGKEVRTLAAIGTEHSLTRERVRQIEKDIVRQLKKHGLSHAEFQSTKEMLIGAVHEHGKVVAQDQLLRHMGVGAEQDRNAIIFLLNLVEELENFTHENYKTVWASVLFNRGLLHGFGKNAREVFEKLGRPAEVNEFLERFRGTDFYQENTPELSEKVMLNFLDLVSDIEQNAFGRWGLSKWKEIKPKDVGDKAYLVMKHHGKPEHYSAITDMINRAKFSPRTAYKETVHNELIKDSRFVLIGRGVYALAEWGYTPGVVSDVIREVLTGAKGPLTRDEIVERVLGRRQVKKNTVLVGLSNKKLFKKVGKNQYALA